MEQFSLRWNNYPSEVSGALGSLRNDEDLVDVTLSCEGKKLKAHKLLLSACSNYFLDIFKENPCQHPVIVFRNFKFKDLQAVIDYIYMGEVSVEQNQLESILEIAHLLQVKGLTDSSEDYDEENSVLKATCNTEAPACTTPPKPGDSLSPPLKKRKTSNNEARKEPSPSENSPCVEPNVESNNKDCVLSDTEDASLMDVQDVLVPVLKASDNSNKCEFDQIPPDEICQPKAVITAEGVQEKPAVQNAAQDNQNVRKEKTCVEACVTKTNLPKPASLSTNEAEELTHSATASKKPKLEDKLVKPCKEENLGKPAAKPSSLSKGRVHIPKGLTVTVLTVEEQTSVKPNDLHCVQPSEEDSVLRSENARTPVGEEVCSFQSNQFDQLDEIGLTSADQIKPREPEMAEEAPQLESEQGTADVPPEEEPEPEFDYYGCEICKSESKAYDRLSFTHKCPICPCMCFCSHLLKEHMRVIHGWFNVQRKFTQNY